MLLYIVYLTLFVAIVLMQLSTHKSYNLKEVSDIIKGESAFQRILSSRYSNATGELIQIDDFEFEDITTTGMVMDWVGTIFNNYVFVENGVIANQNYVFGNPRARLALRLYKISNNDNKDNNEAITDKMPNIKYDFHDALDKEHENKVPLELVNGDIVYHRAAGTYDSPLEKGGYVVDFNANDQDLADTVAALYLDESTILGWAFIILEFVFYNRNLDATVSNNVIFTRSPSGFIDKKYEVSVIWDYYKTPTDYFRACLEIILVLLYI